MTDFFDKLRDDAQQLRFTPDDVMASRVAARVRARVAAQPTVAQMLAAWLRPAVASVAALALAVVVSLTYVEQSDTTATTLEAMTSQPVDISVDGDTFRVVE